MIIKYKIQAKWLYPEIVRVECDRETERSLWIKGRRVNKFNFYDQYHNTFDGAKRSLVSKIEDKIGIHQVNIAALEDKLTQVELLKE